MATISGAVGAYYSVKSMNASIAAKATLLKITQDTMAQNMNNLLKTMSRPKTPISGNIIDVRI